MYSNQWRIAWCGWQCQMLFMVLIFVLQSMTDCMLWLTVSNIFYLSNFLYFNQWRTVCCGWQCQMFFIYPIFCTSISDGLHAVVDSIKCFLLVLSRELEQWNANIAIAQVNLSPLADHRGLWSYPLRFFNQGRAVCCGWQCQVILFCSILWASISDELCAVVDSVKCFLLVLFFVLQSVTDCG